MTAALIYAVTALIIWGRLMYGLGHDRKLDGLPWFEKALWTVTITVAAATWVLTFPLAVIWQAVTEASQRGGNGR